MSCRAAQDILVDFLRQQSEIRGDSRSGKLSLDMAAPNAEQSYAIGPKPHLNRGHKGRAFEWFKRQCILAFSVMQEAW